MYTSEAHSTMTLHAGVKITHIKAHVCMSYQKCHPHHTEWPSNLLSEFQHTHLRYLYVDETNININVKKTKQLTIKCDVVRQPEKECISHQFSKEESGCILQDTLFMRKKSYLKEIKIIACNYCFISPQNARNT